MRICNVVLAWNQWSVFRNLDGNHAFFHSFVRFTVCGGVPKFWFQNIQFEVQTPRSKSTRWPFVTNSAPHRAPQKRFWHKEPNYISSMGRESSGTQNADLAPEGYGWPGVSVHIAVSLDSKTCGPFCLSCRLSQQLVFKGCGTVWGIVSMFVGWLLFFLALGRTNRFLFSSHALPKVCPLFVLLYLLFSIFCCCQVLAVFLHLLMFFMLRVMMMRIMTVVVMIVMLMMLMMMMMLRVILVELMRLMVISKAKCTGWRPHLPEWWSREGTDSCVARLAIVANCEVMWQRGWCHAGGPTQGRPNPCIFWKRLWKWTQWNLKKTCLKNKMRANWSNFTSRIPDMMSPPSTFIQCPNMSQ